ncbi:nucleoside deaminase [Pseudomonas sp. NPDC089407]|uniref:nucleoside deaminase n=1 Tax=Pseudomonas sp. NPDC089407 TaxID=3364464 RepID=UPI00384C8A91
MSANDFALDAQQAVAISARQALLADHQGTFAVGGCIIENATGKIVVALHNQVLKPFAGSQAQPPYRLHDPTAHGERQLVDWYYDNQHALGLPPTHELTVITSLDPCAMCAGALITAGFNVAVSAHDSFAGINYNGRFDFPSLPAGPRLRAQARWGYYAVGTPWDRGYVGSVNGPVYAGECIDAATLSLTRSVFEASVNLVHDESSSTGLTPSALKDPATLPALSTVRQALESLSRWSLRVKSENPRIPGLELAEPLLDTALQSVSGNAVAMLDPFGNLLACLAGAEQRSPIRTAFMETTRSYAALRWRLMNYEESAVRDEALQYLPHPRHCTFILLRFPNPAESEAVMTLGAYGSTVERHTLPSFPSSLQYVMLPAGCTAKAVAQLAQRLPPFYTSNVEVAPCQVHDEALIEAVSSGLAQAQRAEPVAERGMVTSRP